MADRLPLPGPDRYQGNHDDELVMLMRHIEVDPDGCWLWTASRTPGGYGAVGRWSAGGPTVAHRRIWLELVGPLAEGVDLDHLCRVRHCVNPDHLEPVPRSENLQRGKRWKRDQARQGLLLCSEGHQKEVFTDGSVRCRECRNARRRVAAPE